MTTLVSPSFEVRAYHYKIIVRVDGKFQLEALAGRQDDRIFRAEQLPIAPLIIVVRASQFYIQGAHRVGSTIRALIRLDDRRPMPNRGVLLVRWPDRTNRIVGPRHRYHSSRAGLHSSTRRRLK